MGIWNVDATVKEGLCLYVVGE